MKQHEVFHITTKLVPLIRTYEVSITEFNSERKFKFEVMI